MGRLKGQFQALLGHTVTSLGRVALVQQGNNLSPLMDTILFTCSNSRRFELLVEQDTVNGRLRKRYGRNTYDFTEGDLIYKIKGQAKEVKSLKGARRVTALLCFTKGDVDIPANKVGSVYVVAVADLVSTLLQLDSSRMRYRVA